MTVDDAKKTAYGLIQGYIGPDHQVMECRVSTAPSCKRYKRPISKAGRIGEKQKL